MDFDLILLTCTFGWGEALAEKHPVNRNNRAVIKNTGQLFRVIFN